MQSKSYHVIRTSKTGKHSETDWDLSPGRAKNKAKASLFIYSRVVLIDNETGQFFFDTNDK